MNIQHLRRSLKEKWLDYYEENSSWLSRLSVWVDCNGQVRPSASFILATLSTLEPKLTEILPLIVDLNNHPDRIVIALGLNFNPEQELSRLKQIRAEFDNPPNQQKYLPVREPTVPINPSRRSIEKDEACEGRGKSTP